MKASAKTNAMFLNKSTVTRLHTGAGQRNRKMALSITTLTSRGI